MQRPHTTLPQYNTVPGFLFTTTFTQTHTTLHPYIQSHIQTDNIVKQFLVIKGVVQLLNPLFSPDLNPLDFFLLLRLKRALKGKRFEGIPDIRRKVTRLLNITSKEDFDKVSRTCISDLSNA